MKIDVFSDTVCPWCYIGKRRLERALAAPGAPEAEISWRPFQLNPGMPAGGMDRAEYLAWKFGGAAPARRAYGAVRDAAAAESLPLRLDAIARTPNTLASHRLIHYAAGRGAQNAAVDALFRAYFTEGADIGDIDVLTGAAAAAGLDRAAARAWLESDEDRALVADRDRRARRMGVRGVPFFIVAGRYAVSGAHEPEFFRQVFAAADSPPAAPAASG